MKKTTKFLALMLSTTIIMTSLIGCGNNNEEKKVKEPEKKQEVVKEKSKEEVIEAVNQDVPVEELVPEESNNGFDPNAGAYLGDGPSNTENNQPFKEYYDVFPKWIEKEFMPRCQNYFLGNPYENGEVYRLRLTTGCYGEYSIKFQLTKLKVTVRTESSEWSDDISGISQESSKTFFNYDNISPNTCIVKKMEDGYPTPIENNNITGYLIIGDGEGGNAVCNTFGDTPFTKELIYAPGTEIVNNKIYYTFGEYYGEDASFKADFTNVNKNDTLTINTNIQGFSDINGKEFKADWEFGIEDGDSLKDDLIYPNEMHGGYDWNEQYPNPQSYDSLLY